MPRPPAPRVVVHLDMDAFYASVEVRENPSLAGKPVIIGHRGPRGVVSTCSYEARRFGVRSAMPSVTAMRLCPQAIWLPGRMALYAEVSRALREILDSASPLVEPLSIDEAFIDLTGIARDLAHGGRLAADLKAEIRRRERLSSSAGIAPNKFLAKVASDLEKPDGLVVFPLDDVPARLWPLPVQRLWGVGPKTAERLAGGGVTTVADVLRLPVARLSSLVGEGLAHHLVALARGEDDRPVTAGGEAKSISEERTYAEDLRDPDAIDRALLARSEGVARQLRHGKLAGRTVQIKVRTGDFETVTRAETLPEGTDLAETIVAVARRLLATKVTLRGRGIRLLGVGVSHLGPRDAGQASLFADPAEEKRRRAALVSDAVREKFGDVVGRARLVAGPGKKRGDDDGEASSLPTVD